MEITFQTTAGERYAATLEDSRLTDVRPLSQPSQPSVPGSGPPQEQSPPEPQPPEQEGSSGPMKPADRIFVEQLKAVLVNNRARKQLRHKQKGILDTRKLVQTQLDSTSVWRQHNRKDSQRNYSVLLLVDESGSMNGEKADLAQDVTQEVIASLGLVDGVESAVIGFSGNRLVERKRFDNSGQNSLDAIVDSSRGVPGTASGKRIDDLKPSDYENADLIAIEYAIDYLRRHASPKSRLVFVMLSDGAPCNSRETITVVTADMKTQEFCSRIVPKVDRTTSITAMNTLVRKAPDILSFGLGMLQGGQQIPKHKVVKDLMDTRKELIAFLRSALQ